MNNCPAGRNITIKELKTSQDWFNDAVVINGHHLNKVLEPDGWDRKNYQYSWYEEKISFREFIRRCEISTCVWRPKNISLYVD